MSRPPLVHRSDRARGPDPGVHPVGLHLHHEPAIIEVLPHALLQREHGVGEEGAGLDVDLVWAQGLHAYTLSRLGGGLHRRNGLVDHK